MMQCDWVPIDGLPHGYWTCSRCGIPWGGRLGQRRPWPDKSRLRRTCQPRTGAGSAPRSHSISERVVTYIDARERWLAAGSPLRPDAQIALLYERCQGCAEFRRATTLEDTVGLAGGECAACGCRLHHERKLLNKLAWATENCPHDLWRDLISDGCVDLVPGQS